MLLHSLDHSIDGLLHTRCLVGLAQLLAKRYIVLTRHHEQTGNHQRFCLGTFRDVLSSLETLVWIP